MQGVASTKTAAAAAVAVTGSAEGELQQVGIECPRCGSTNTKFCYYNNYNLSQPRHFCKGCRRYWTKGGALRNVPVGGGTRKNSKRSSATAAASSSTTTTSTTNYSSSSPPPQRQSNKRLPSPSSNANNINIPRIQPNPLNINHNPFLRPAPVSISYPTFEINGCSFSSLLEPTATAQLYGGLYESFTAGETGILAGENEMNMGLSLAGAPTAIDVHSSTDSSGNESGAAAAAGGVTAGHPLPESLLGSTQGDSTGCWNGGWSTDLAIYTPGSGFVP